MTEPVPSEKPRRRCSPLMIVLIILILPVLADSVYLWHRRNPEPPVVETAKTPPDDADARSRRLVLGTWHYEDQDGKQTMTLMEDGTGTRVVELSGWSARLYAARLKFNLKWWLEGGHLKEVS